MSLLGLKRRNTHHEQMFSALPLKADICRQSGHVRFVPTGDMGFCTNPMLPK
jgi:hypothetical protein